MINRINLRNYNPTSSDKFFFDNNIWMLLNCPIGNVDIKLQQLYSSLQHLIISSRASIYINSLVLSEFANASLRISFDMWKRTQTVSGLDYKRDFIPTKQYQDSAKSVIGAIKNILALTMRQPDDFHNISMGTVYTYFEQIDFNDSYYVEFCKANSYILVTRDKDFDKIQDAAFKCITLS